MIDFVIYADTDSNFYTIEKFIETHVGLEKWNMLDDDQKVEICRRIASAVSDHVNSKAYHQVQLKDFNSQRTDFKIVFEQEIIAKAGLFVSKKMYGLGIVDKDGERTEELFVKGLDIIKSATPSAIKPRLRNIMAMIISGASDKDIIKTIQTDRRELLKVEPPEIAVNIGANHLHKYIKNGEAIKGTPWHLRGINNYHKLLGQLNLEKKYERLGGVGEKIKLVYAVQPNQYNVESIGFIRWPKEFDAVGVKVDYAEMIDKCYLNKIEILLNPIGKLGIVRGGDIDSFFN